MKLNFLAGAALLTLTVSAYAGPEPKDTKDMKQVTPAAQCTSDDGFYVGVFGGANFSQDNGNGRSEYNTPIVPGTTVTHSHMDDSLGGVGGIKAGYKFQSTAIGGGFALQPAAELEAFYVGSDLDLNDTTATAFFGNSHTNSSASVDSGAFFANGVLNLKTPWHVAPYIGAGIGAEYLSISDKTLSTHIGTNPNGNGGFAVPTISSSYSDDAFAFAVQAIAGINYDLTEHWTLFTEYKFVAAIDPSFTYHSVYTSGDSLKYNPDFIGQHLITAGIKYNF